MRHFLPARLLEDEVRIDLVGCGGNGSQMLTGLARLNHALTALGHPGLIVTAYDPDTVSEANVGRQLFSPSDVGLNKAAILVHRLNAWFGLRWGAIEHAYAASPFGEDAHIVVSCVDSRRSRARLAGMRALYWMDLGNRAADGQVVLGTCGEIDQHQTGGAPKLPTAAELFPEIADATLPEDDAPSCGLAQALERQELFVNQAVVTPALEILWRLFRFGSIDWHGAFVNLAAGTMRPLPVDPAAWERMGWKPKVKAAKRRRENANA